MAKYSKKAQKTVASAMRKMKKGELTSGQSGKKVTHPKQAVAIGLSEAREKGAKVPAPKKKTTPKKKTAVKKAATKKAAPKKIAKKTAPKKTAKKAAPKKSVAQKTAVKKKTAPAKKVAPKKAVKKTIVKKASPKKISSAKKTAVNKAAKKRTQQPVSTDKLIVSQPLEINQPPVAIPVDNLFHEQLHEKTVDPNDIPVTDFSKFTAKADPRQNMKVSTKAKGGMKPSGKKPLWN